MIVPTMTIPEAIASAKADIPALYNKTSRQIQEQEREHRKNRRAGDIVRREEYTSPTNNKWLYVLTTNKKHSIRNFFTWFHAKEGIFGLQPSYEGLHFLFTPHFFTRYRERSGNGEPTAIENLTAFFFRNSATYAMRTGREHLGFPAFIGSVPDGYVLGTLHEGDGYHRCRTFVSHTQAFPEQEEQWEGLDAVRQLQFRYPALFAQLK